MRTDAFFCICSPARHVLGAPTYSELWYLFFVSPCKKFRLKVDVDFLGRLLSCKIREFFIYRFAAAKGRYRTKFGPNFDGFASAGRSHARRTRTVYCIYFLVHFVPFLCSDRSLDVDCGVRSSFARYLRVICVSHVRLLSVSCASVVRHLRLNCTFSECFLRTICVSLF